MSHVLNSNLSEVAFLYGKLIKARVTRSTIVKDIEENPYYPSLYSLTSTFSKYNITSEAYSVSSKDFDSLEPPFIAFISVPNVGDDFILVSKINKETVQCFYKNRKPINFTRLEFLNRFKEVIWVAESSEINKEEHKKNQSIEIDHKMRNIVLTFGIAVLLLLFSYYTIHFQYSISFTVILFCKITGLIISTLLLQLEIGSANPLLKNICSIATYTDCDAVLKSKYSSILGIRWSEIGFYYFSSTFLILLSASLSYSVREAVLILLSIAASPYIIFSIYYQWKVLKQWCPLCILVQFTLALESLWALTFLRKFKFIVAWQDLIPVTSYVLLPILIWHLFKPIFKRSLDSTVFSAAYKRLQYHPDIFKVILEQQPKIVEGWEELGIKFGSDSPSHTIVKICNPYCGPCSEAHKVLDEILETNKTIQVRIIFTATNDPGDFRSPIVTHFINISFENNLSKTKKVLHEWYSSDTKDYKSFIRDYPAIKKSDSTSIMIEKMKMWCDKSGVTSTPTIYVDGHRLPHSYDVEELKKVL